MKIMIIDGGPFGDFHYLCKLITINRITKGL